MQYRYLGRTGISVSNLCLGAMSFGSYRQTSYEDSARVIHAALDAGINFVDTADVYSAGESEEIVGKALAGRRDDVVLATKFYNPMGKDRNMRGASRRWIVRAVEDSLRRLGTDYIDLYQVHRWDENTATDETLSALSDLVRSGKVRAIGSSTYPAEAVVEAQWVADHRGHIPFSCEQPPYSILVRGPERDVFPACEKYGMGVIVWSPLNGGWLTGKYQAEQAPVDSRLGGSSRGGNDSRLSTPGAERKRELVDQLKSVADDAGLDLITLAIAFTLAHPAVTASIIGPRTLEQLQSQLPAADIGLTDDVLDRIDAIVQPGRTISPGDIAFKPQSLRHTHRRRRNELRTMTN